MMPKTLEETSQKLQVQSLLAQPPPRNKKWSLWSSSGGTCRCWHVWEAPDVRCQPPCFLLAWMDTVSVQLRATATLQGEELLLLRAKKKQSQSGSSEWQKRSWTVSDCKVQLLSCTSETCQKQSPQQPKEHKRELVQARFPFLKGPHQPPSTCEAGVKHLSAVF